MLKVLKNLRIKIICFINRVQGKNVKISEKICERVRFYLVNANIFH